MQAITTKYHGPGNTRGARISATSESGIRIYVPYDHAARNPHWTAAEALCHKLGWRGEYLHAMSRYGAVFTPAEADRFMVSDPKASA